MASQTGPGCEPGLFEICSHLFRYASRKTRCLQLVAVLAAFGAGATIPYVIILWGDLANSFLRFVKHDPSYTATAFQREISITSLRMVYIFFAKFVLGYIYMVLFTTTSADISFNIRVKYVEIVLGQDVSTSESVDSELQGGAGQGVSEIEQLEVGLGEQLGMAIQLTSVVLSAFIISVVKQWKLGLAVSTMIPATVITVGLTVAVDVRLETKIRQLYEVTSIMAKDVLSNIRDVLASTASDDILSRYDKVLEKAKEIGIKKAPAIGIQHASEVFFVTCGYALSFWYGTQLYSAGGVSIGSILTVFFCVALANSSLTGISVQVLELTKAFSVAQKIMALIECQHKALATSSISPSSKLDDVRGCLKLQNVHFSYPSRPHIPVYTDLTCMFPTGKTTAIVGASGAGKSTVVALLERWFELVSGSITLDGVDIRQLDVHWLRKQIGLVQQEPTLFQGSVYSNVSRGLIGTFHEFSPVSEKMQLVEKACSLANATHFVLALPQGYNTLVGPNGNSLSGGQKQRLAIARAIVSDPKILILDEATAALDAHSEEAVEAALEQAAMNRTTILITHKPSQAMKANNILVFTPDGISESGPPETLIRSGGLFASFVAHGSPAKKDVGRGSSNALRNKATGQTSNKLDQVDMSQQSNDDISQVGSYSLARCIKILMCNERRHWALMVSLFIPCLLGGLIFPAEAILFGKMVNIFILPVADVHNATNFWALMFFIVALIILVVYGLIGHNAAVFCYVIGRDIRLNYLQSFISQEVAFFENPKHSPGVLTAKLLQHPLEIEDFFCRNIPVVLIIVVTILSCSILAIATGWKLGLVTVFGALAPICIAGLIRIQLGYINEKRTHEIYYESAGFVSEYVAAPRTVNSLCMENTLVSEYRDLLQGPLRQAKKNALYTMFFLALTDSLQICGMALAFWYGGMLLSSRRYSLAEFYTIFASVIFGAQATTKLFGFAYSFTKGKFAANHVLGVQITQKVRDLSTAVPEDSQKGFAISFRDVHFRYPTRIAQVFCGLSFDIKKGQRVAFVGSSGCGKSTVLSLLERFYEPSSGEILLAGRRIADLEVDKIRRGMALVPQEHFLYRGTIRDNLCLGLARSVTDAELKEACKAAAIYDFVASLPDGFETPCGGSGGNIFSGGQRQRFIIARAFVRKPYILLLDEATSALDAENEVLLTETLMALPPDITVVAVAHRFSTIRNFDAIFVLNHGQVAEVGSYEELIGQRGLFYKMVSVGDL